MSDNETPKFKIDDKVIYKGDPYIIIKEPWRGKLETGWFYEIGSTVEGALVGVKEGKNMAHIIRENEIKKI